MKQFLEAMCSAKGDEVSAATWLGEDDEIF
jgi:hypothetical protein